MKLPIKFMPEKMTKVKVKKAKRAKPFAANNASTKMLESAGWVVGTVEQTIPYCFIKRDLFHFVDILAISPSKGIMFVQATGGGNLNSRIKKIKENPIHAIALAAGARIQVHDWIKIKGQKDRECKVFEFLKEENLTA